MPALLRTICDEAPIPFAKLRPDLGERAAAIGAVLAIAMAKVPDQRYRAVSELAADLRLAAAGTLPATTAARAAGVDGGRPTARSVGTGGPIGHDETITATPTA